MSHLPLLQLVIVVALFMTGCTTDTLRTQPVEATLVTASDIPSFEDDLQLEGLSLAIQRELAQLRSEQDREVLRIGERSFRTPQLRDSLERFLELLEEVRECRQKREEVAQCQTHFSQQVREQFLVYRLQSAQLTGYYTPIIQVSTQRNEKFPYPIYRTPDNEDERRLSREAIDFAHALDGKGYELYYAADRFDLYVINIEGGAHLIVNDNGRRYSRYLHYQRDNGLEFTNLYDYMQAQGLLQDGQESRLQQRAVLADNPQRLREIFSSCPGYVFFKASDTPPIGSSGAPLTAGRSLASDPAYYPVKGLITYVVAPLPIPHTGLSPEENPSPVRTQIMQRFFIDQDIGHHILGHARADLFFGEGAYATFLGNNFMTRGTLYLLLLK